MPRPPHILTCTDAELDALWPVALSLSLCTGTPFRLEPEDGAAALAPKAAHLALARAAAALCDAPLGESLAFPADGEGRVAHVTDAHLDVGALGVCSALTWLLPPLSLAGGGALHLRGATHPVRGPVSQTATLWWPTVLAAFGRRATTRLERAGFAPQSAGALTARISGGEGDAPALVELLRRGTLHDVRILSLVPGGQSARASRQLEGALAALKLRGIDAESEAGARALPSDSSGGGAVWIQAQFEHSTAVFSSVALPGEAAELTGERAAAQLVDFLGTPGATDGESAALLLLWGALLASGRLGPSTPGTTTVQAPGTSASLRAIARGAEALLDVHVTVDASGRCSAAPRAR